MIIQHGYSEVEEIGKGGFSIVFRARNASRNELVALKLQFYDAQNCIQNGEDLKEEANFAKFLSEKVS